ncbi:MAG: hypothetical protein V4696_00845 [Pseudomonadota bacterium]
MTAPITGSRLGGIKSTARRRAEKAEGMAFARAWREKNRGRDWAIPADAVVRPVCPHCRQVLA